MIETLYISVLDGVHCKADKDLVDAIAPCLKYTRTHVKPGQFGKQIKRADAYAIDRRNGRFATGLLPRVCKYLETQKVPWGIKYDELFYTSGTGMGIPPIQKPKLAHFVLRPDQLMLINKATAVGRGVIKAPTGTGKTVITMGFLSQYPYNHALILVHRLDLLDQFYTRMAQAGFAKKDINLVSGVNKPTIDELVKKQYTIAMVPSLRRYDLSKLCTTWDIIVGDEIHHCVDKKGGYASILNTNLAPIKLGFTATLHTDMEKVLALEGTIGPVIGELTMQEAVQSGSMARAKVTLIDVPYNVDIAEHRKWKDLYQYGIVHNRVRNGLILKAVKERIVSGKTCLIMVKELAHGGNLVELSKLMGLPLTFIHGKHNTTDRKIVREALNNRHLKCVVTTDIWREGVDIPTLNTVANACGGKSEIQTLQAVGRGARKTEGKDEFEIIDCLDPYRYLAEHTVRRLQTYNHHGWL